MHLLFDHKAKNELEWLEQNARGRKFSFAHVLRFFQNDRKHPHIAKDHHVLLKHGVYVGYTIEQHGTQWVRHISISVDHPSEILSDYETGLILSYLGFNNPASQCERWLDEEQVPIRLHLIEPYEEVVKFKRGKTPEWDLYAVTNGWETTATSSTVF